MYTTFPRVRKEPIHKTTKGNKNKKVYKVDQSKKEKIRQTYRRLQRSRVRN